MARSIADIQTAILNEKALHAELNSLNSASATAIWRVWVFIMAFAHYLHESLWDAFKVEVNTFANQQIIGTTTWYKGLALAYLGGTLVTRASCRDNGTKVILKVAKTATGNVTQNLTALELTGLSEYIQGSITATEKKLAGTDLDIVSQTADLVSLKLLVQYTGVAATVDAAIKTKVKDYLLSIPFDGALSKALLENQLLQVPGVLDVAVDELAIDLGLGFQVINGLAASPDAGYWQIGKDGSGNDLIITTLYL